MTEYQRMTDALLRDRAGVGLVEFLRERRAEGHSFRRISRQLYDATGGAVDVSNVSVMHWHRTLCAEEPAA